MKTDVIPDPDSIILDGKENIYISSLAEICLFKHVDDIVGRMKSCHCHSSINISDTKTIFYHVKKNHCPTPFFQAYFPAFLSG